MLESIVIISMLVLSAFFSGMEIAYVSANKIHIELEKRQSNFLGSVLTKLTAKPSRYLITMLIGNNIALVVYGFVSGELILRYLGMYFPSLSVGISGLLLQTLISTLLILITAEFLPKVFFQIYSNELLKFFSLPAYLIYVLLWPISLVSIYISDFILKVLFKTEGDVIQQSFSKMELGNYINEQVDSASEQEQLDSEIQIFQNALDFAEVKAREIMVPRTELIAVTDDTSIDTLNNLFVETGLSKILIYRENLDDITSYVHSFDLFGNPETVNNVKRAVINVPESMLIKDVLNLLTKRRKSVAIVIDEYGGTAGLITIEDIIEELFGEIEDEHDIDELIEIEHENNQFTFSTRLEVDYLNKTYDLQLPESEQYETLGGLITYHHESIPELNEIVEIEGYEFTILEKDHNKINAVLMKSLNNE